ncbi:MAG TPA: hypothetical protein VMM55_12315, partial [Thermohalobaculum sp.]|nr:hypothetical protein [Thermohalobaculum sp.]
LSFLALALAPGEGLARAWRARAAAALPAADRAREVAGWLSFAGFAALLALGFLGPHDPLLNLLPLTVWTALWVGLTALTALVGDVWRWLNPWVAPWRLARRLGLAADAPPRWIAWLGLWPAVAGLLAFGWFELVHVTPADPGLLARVTLGYWLLTFALMLVAGEAWLGQGEFLSVFFRFVGRLAPVAIEGGRVRLALPGARLLAAPPLPLSGVAFVSAALATVTFDGLSRTFLWLDLVGTNPLEFPGRSAVTGVNTAGYAAACVAMTAAFAGAVRLGRRLAPAPVPARVELGRLALTLLPIALAYHLSHYLTVLLVNGQYWWAALGDPLGRGWGLTGFDSHDVTTSFLYERGAVRTIWTVQAGAVIAGHLLAVLLAHLTALSLHGGDRRAAARGQLPLAGLMVLYTLLGLWLLATPTGA